MSVILRHTDEENTSDEGRFSFVADWDFTGTPQQRLGAHRGPWSLVVCAQRGQPATAFVMFDDTDSPRWSRSVFVASA